MICYRDMTFCSAFGKTCSNGACHRAFTEREETRASDWWAKNRTETKFGPPVAFSDFSDGCTKKVAA